LAIFSTNPALRNYWYAVATDFEVTAGPVARTILDEPIVIYRDSQGQTVAAPDRCPHRQAPLSAGSVSGGVLTCCYHGWQFGVDGACINIPSASADAPIPRKAHLQCYASKVVHGLVWVCLGEPCAEIPDIPQEHLDNFRRINNPVQHWSVSATRMTDNFLDIAHFPWVHLGTFGNNQRTEVDHINLQDLSAGFYGYEYSVVAENPPEASLTSGQQTDDVEREMSTGFSLPFTVRSTIAYASGMHHILLLLTTPIDDTNSYFTFVIWRNDDFRISAEDLAAFDRAIGGEDKVMLEKIPGVLPLTNGVLASTAADKASTAWRLQFTRMLGLEQQSSEGG